MVETKQNKRKRITTHGKAISYVDFLIEKKNRGVVVVSTVRFKRPTFLNDAVWPLRLI